MNLKSEMQLVEASQNGDLNSFSVLYERYYGAMVALAHSLIADRHSAEDAAQETFAIACRHLSDLKSKDKFGFWLAGICRNVAKQNQRSKNKFVTLDGMQLSAGEKDKEERREVVRKAMRKLRAIHREPLILRYYDNLPYEQIASILGISTKAVHGRLIRAKRKIAEQLKRDSVIGDTYGNIRKQ